LNRSSRAGEETKPQFKHRYIAAATIGNALEFYDFITYAYFSIQIGRVFFPSHSAYASLMLSLATFGAGFLTRPLGGIVIGLFSDRAGRKPAMMLSFTMMGVAIVGIALIPSYAQIGIAAPILAILARMLQGFSLGGEVGPTTAYLLEAAPIEKRGQMVAWQGASQSIAATIGAAVGLSLSHFMTPGELDSYGWRIAFLLGAVTVPFGLWIRYGLVETLHEEEIGTATTTAPTRLGAARENARVIVLGLVILAYATIATYITDYMTTFAQDTLHMHASAAFAVTVVSNLAAVVAILYAGRFSDRIGRRPVMIWFNLVALILTYPVFLWIVTERSSLALLLGIGVLTFVGSSPFAGFYAGLTESLPKNIRGSSFAIIYAVSIATFGGTCQLVVTWLIHVTGNPMAPAWYMLFAMFVGQIAMWMMPETAPSQIAVDTLEAGAAGRA
jgi:MFS family permease